jgi:hypothetical protein
MHNIDHIHPSPAILSTKTERASVFRAVKSDAATKRFPILEDDVTRYDVLSGRGGKTNHHEASHRLLRRRMTLL